jgi:protein SCO1
MVMIRRAIALIPVLVLAASCTPAEPEAIDTGIDPAAGRDLGTSGVLGASVADVALPDISRGGAPFRMVAPEGHVLVVYFGYTFCPDICPTTLSDLRSALASMGDAADRVEVAMVTVDPMRDVDDVLQPYLQSFIDTAHPLRTTDQAELDAAADAFGADFSVITVSDGNIEVSHTAYLYAVDDRGVVRVVWPFGVEPERIAEDLGSVLAGITEISTEK